MSAEEPEETFFLLLLGKAAYTQVLYVAYATDHAACPRGARQQNSRETEERLCFQAFGPYCPEATVRLG